MKQKSTLLLLLLALGLTTRAQVTIGEQAEPRTFSALELISNQRAGLRMPLMTTGQRDEMTAGAEFQAEKAGLAEGLTIYNTTIHCLEYWNGQRWIATCEGDVPSDYTLYCAPDAKQPYLVDYDPIEGTSSSVSTTGGRYVVANSINPTDDYADIPQSIVITVNVTGAGAYNLSTDTVNGMYYTARGMFDAPGEQQVTLVPNGKPLATGLQGDHIIRNNDDLAVNCNVSVPYSYRKFNIISCAPTNGYYGFSANNTIAWNILKGSATFGSTGMIPCEASPDNTNYDVSIAGGSGALSATELVTYINDNNADVLYLGQLSGTENPDVMNVIKDFVFNKHGVVIFTEEYADGSNGYATNLIEQLFDINDLSYPVVRSTGDQVGGTNTMDYGGVLSSTLVSDIISGPFGNLVGRKQILTSGVSGYLPAANTMSPNLIILSRLSDNNGTSGDNQILSIQHSKLGVYMSFDNTFGGYEQTNGNTMPPGCLVSNTTGEPELPAAGNTTTGSDNAMLFANLFAWALQYGAYNIDSSYRVSTTASTTYPSTFVPRTPVTP